MADYAVWSETKRTGSLRGHEVPVDAEGARRGCLVAVLAGVFAGHAL